MLKPVYSKTIVLTPVSKMIFKADRIEEEAPSSALLRNAHKVFTLSRVK